MSTTTKTTQTPTQTVSDPEDAAIQARRERAEAQLPAARAALDEIEQRLAAVNNELAALARRTAPPVVVDEFGRQTFYPNQTHPAAEAIVSQERQNLENARTHLEQQRLEPLAAVRSLEAELAACDQEARRLRERRAEEAEPKETPAGAIGTTEWLRQIRDRLELAAHPERLPAPPEPKRVMLDTTLWYTSDRQHGVPDGDPAAASQLGRAGCITTIDAAELERLDLHCRPVPPGVG